MAAQAAAAASQAARVSVASQVEAVQDLERRLDIHGPTTDVKKGGRGRQGAAGGTGDLGWAPGHTEPALQWDWARPLITAAPRVHHVCVTMMNAPRLSHFEIACLRLNYSNAEHFI